MLSQLCTVPVSSQPSLDCNCKTMSWEIEPPWVVRVFWHTSSGFTTATAFFFLPYPQVRMLFKGRFLFVCYVFFWDRPLGKWHSERAFSSSFLFWQRDAALMEQRSHFLKTVFVSFSAEVASLVSVKTFNLEKSICSAVYSHPRSSLPASQTFSVLC